MKTNLRKERGITLVALVVTIIVLLILAGVTLATVTGYNGILPNAKKAADLYNESANNDQEIIAEIFKTFQDYVRPSYGIYGEMYQTPEEERILGYDGTKLHIGDFVEYSTGNTFSETVAKPTEQGQFGGYTAGTKLDESAATPLDTTYNYIRDIDGNIVTGWRVFDISDDGVITLISAANPEDYYHASGGYTYETLARFGVWPYMGDYLEITPRNWNEYVNTRKGATGARLITREDLVKWYAKYMDITLVHYDGVSFGTIYEKNAGRLSTLIDNYSWYWLASSYVNDRNMLYRVAPNHRFVCADYNCSYGIRVLVTLSPDVKLSSEPTGTIIIGDRRNASILYKYNKWAIVD